MREVPAFRAEILRPRSTRYVVCVPVLNEGERIARQLARMAPLAAQVDIVLADGGSSDGSVAREPVSPHGVRAVLVKTGPGRLSAQMRMAMAWALDEGFDHVQGSRYVVGGHAENTPLTRHLGVQLLHAPLISIAARFRYTDTTNGFRAYSARFLLDPRVAPFRDVFVRYELLFYLSVRAPQLGFRVTEIPVARRYPKNAPPPTKIAGLRGRFAMLGELLAVALGRFQPH